MSSDRPENRRKYLRLLLIFGLASSAVAMSAAMFAWAWGPRATSWILPPQAIVEEEASPKVDKRWTALHMPVATISGPMTTNTPGPEPRSDEIAVMAEVGSAFAPAQPPDESDSPPADLESYAGLGALNVGGGTGRSSRGTINPNNSGPGALSFPGYSGGGSAGGGGDAGFKKPAPTPGECEGPDASSKPQCQTPSTTGPGEGGSCVTTTSIINGQTVTTQSGDCDAEDDETGDQQETGTGGSCVTTTSIINGQAVTTQSGDCGTGDETEDEQQQAGAGGSCVTTTSIINGQAITTQNGDCGTEDEETDDLPPTNLIGAPMCLSEEGCETGSPVGTGPLVAVPEPGSLALLLTGLAGLLALRRRR